MKQGCKYNYNQNQSVRMWLHSPYCIKIPSRIEKQPGEIQKPNRKARNFATSKRTTTTSL